MSDELFMEIYEKVRVMLWFIFCCVVVGALIGNELVVLLGIFMILTISIVLIIAKYSKNPAVR